jgi:hypothetical protein
MRAKIKGNFREVVRNRRKRQLPMTALLKSFFFVSDYVFTPAVKNENVNEAREIDALVLFLHLTAFHRRLKCRFHIVRLWMMERNNWCGC